MASIKLRYSAHTDNTGKGALYFQIIQGKTIRQVGTGCRIFRHVWHGRRGETGKELPSPESENSELKIIRDKILLMRRRLEKIIEAFEVSGQPYSAEDIVLRYKESSPDNTSVFGYMGSQAERMKKLGKMRTAETYRQTLNSFMRFRNDVDLYFDMLDSDIVERYECYMRAHCLSRNTTSFYMRVLRCIYNRAAEEGLTVRTELFKRVYTGVDKTAKRAITMREIRRIKELDLTDRPDIGYARDLFMFSFYLRGISFVDLAYLRKRDLANGYITYARKKTGQQLTVRWEPCMQEIVDRYPENPTQYLLPVITRQDGTERSQYLNGIQFVNRKLKLLAALAGIDTPLTMYVSRHSWASIAKSRNVPLSVISEGMGHDNEETTRIYLCSIQTNLIDEANSRILKGL